MSPDPDPVRSSPESPLLVCIGGVPGAGKTTVGALLAAAGPGAALVDLDSVTTPLMEAVAALLSISPDFDRPPLVDLRAARYGCLAQVVADNLGAGRDVIAVAPFTTEAGRADRWRGWARRLGANRVALCWLDVDPDTAGRRIQRRGAVRDRAKAGPEFSPRPADAAAVDRPGLDLVLDVSFLTVDQVVERVAGSLGWR